MKHPFDYMKITYSIDNYEVSYIIVAKCIGISKDVKNDKISSFKVQIINVIEDNDTVLDDIQKGNDDSVIYYAFDPRNPPLGYKIDFLTEKDNPEYFI